MIDIALRVASQFAPGLIRHLAGDRAGDIAQSILNLGRQVTGIDDPEEIQRMLQEDVTLAHDFRMRAVELELEEERAHLADRQGARDMRLELARLGRTDWMMYAVGLIVVLGLVAVVLAIFVTPDLSDEQLNLLNVLGGGLLAGFMAVVQYFFGSSRGSKNKDSQIQSLIDRR